MKKVLPVFAAGALLVTAGCWTFTVKHKIEPIYITMDVNVKVEKQLNEFFDYEDEAAGLEAQTGTTDSTRENQGKGELK